MNKKTKIELGIIITVVVVSSLFFINKAVHIDDWVTLMGIRFLSKTSSLNEIYHMKGGFIGIETAVYEGTRPPLLNIIAYWIQFIDRRLK